MDLIKVSAAMEKRQYEAGKRIITQGDIGDHFYVILQVPWWWWWRW